MLYEVITKQFAVLLGKGIFRLGQNFDQGIHIQFFQRGNHRKSSDELRNQAILHQVFRLDLEPLSENETRPQRQVLRNNLLYVSLASLTSLALIFYALFATGQLSIPNVFFLGLSLAIILRITSYNVCYTKLLRAMGEHAQQVSL